MWGARETGSDKPQPPGSSRPSTLQRERDIFAQLAYQFRMNVHTIVLANGIGAPHLTHSAWREDAGESRRGQILSNRGIGKAAAEQILETVWVSDARSCDL